MTVVVGGEIDELSEVEGSEHIQKCCGCFTVRGVDVDVEVTEQQDGR